MRLPGLAVGFAPWVLFLVLPHRGDDVALLLSSVLTAAVAAVLAVWNRGRAGTKWLSSSAVVTFGCLAVLSSWVGDYASGAALLVLSGVMAASLFSVPFTEQYAREGLPREYWNSPRFHSVNARISLVWTGCTALVAFSMTVAVGVTNSYPEYFVLAWIVPVLITLVVCRYTAVCAGKLSGAT